MFNYVKYDNVARRTFKSENKLVWRYQSVLNCFSFGDELYLIRWWCVKMHIFIWCSLHVHLQCILCFYISVCDMLKICCSMKKNIVLINYSTLNVCVDCDVLQSFPPTNYKDHTYCILCQVKSPK